MKGCFYTRANLGITLTVGYFNEFKLLFCLPRSKFLERGSRLNKSQRKGSMTKVLTFI